MNRIFGIFIAFLLIPTLPVFGVSKTDAGRQRQEIETKYCRQIAGAGGGTLNCATQSLNCIHGLKPAYTKEQVDKIVTEYCETIGFAAASATQNASSGLLLATPAQEVKSQPNQRQQDIESNLKKETTVPTKKPDPQTDEEQKRLVRTAFSKFCKDDGYVYKDNDAELPSIGVLDANCNAPGNGQLYFSCYKFKTNPAPAQEIHKHFAYYCYTNVTTPTKITTATRPSDHYNKKDAERAAKQEENKVGKRCEIENATSAKYVKKMSGKIVCEPDDCICGYEIVENNFQYSCKKWRQDKPSCYGHESMPDNATKAHYECNKNNKKICVVDECNYKTHYLDSNKNKCIAKSTVKCASDEIVNNVGQCQKNPTVLARPNDPSKQEMSQSDIERDNCVRNQDKKHTKYENGKCVCENNDYEMQDDGVCTLKRAKCKEQSHTKYENGRCVCESDKYEMHSDNNCYMTSAALDAEASEMEDADNAAKDEQLFLETRKEACAIDNLGEWNDKTHKCKCKSGYKLGDDYACHATNKTATNEENKTLCEKDGAGKWNKTLKQCNCNEKNHIFDEETGCVAATKTFTEAQEKMKQLETQLNEKATEMST